MRADSKYYDEYYDYILKGIEPSTKVKKVVFDIVNDITGRKGLGNEFEDIDGDIQDEIIDTWMELLSTNTTNTMKYRIKEVVRKTGSYFLVQNFGLLGWRDMRSSNTYPTLQGARDRIIEMQDARITETKYHY